MRIHYAGVWTWYSLRHYKQPPPQRAPLDLLREAGVPESVMRKLDCKALNNKLETAQEFLSQLRKALSIEEWQQFQEIVLRHAGWKHRNYWHRLKLLDLDQQLSRAGLPAVKQVTFRKKTVIRELCVVLKEPPSLGKELVLPNVSLMWRNLPDAKSSLKHKLIFVGLEEGLAREGFEVASTIRALKGTGPIAMQVKFAATPTQPEWSGIQTEQAVERAPRPPDTAETGHRCYRHIQPEDADESEADSDDYHPGEDDGRPLVDRKIRERRGRRKFRDALRKRYEERCVVTGCEVLALLEAAHIKPYRESNDNHPANGLLLRSDIHTMFDLDLLGIEPNEFRVELHECVAKDYGHLSGATLKCPENRRPSADALRIRYELFRQRLGECP